MNLIESVWQDTAFALRNTGRRPGFAVLVVLMLALGTGANTSIFAALNALLLRPAPVVDSEEFVMVRRGERALFPYADYQEYQSRARVPAGLAASAPWESDLSVNGRSEFITREAVSGNYAAVVGVAPVAGRWFTAEDEAVAVISDSVWERWFNRDSSVLGRQVQSGSHSLTIVGVAPAAFTGALSPLRTDVWIPLRIWADDDPSILNDRRRSLVMIFGRLHPDRSPSEATAEMNAIDARIQSEYAKALESVEPLTVERVRGVAQPAVRSAARAIVTLLTAVVGLVLAIACVNVGNLLLVRGAARQRELAVRRALGASRARLFQQLLTETAVLALAGGACGLLFAQWTNHVIAALMPALPAAVSLQWNPSIDARVLVFSVGISIAAAIVCGMAPAWRLSSPDTVPGLKGEPPRTRARGRSAALVAEIAMSLALLLASGTLLRGVWRLETLDPGFATDNRVYAYTYLPDGQYTPERGRQFYAHLLEELRGLPEVRSAALTYLLPLSPVASECASFRSGDTIQATSAAIDSGFLSTMGISLVEGRDFNVDDAPSSPPVVIVNATLARRLWPRGSAVGQHIALGCETPATAEIVGVARDSKIRSLRETAQPHIYRPFSQRYSSLATIVVESRGPAALMVNTIRQNLQGFGNAVRVYTVNTLTDHMERSYGGMRWATRILALFAIVALGLAVIGLYGVVAHHVVLRTKEIGVRLAVGASPQDVLIDVLRQGLILAAIGIAIGEVASAGLSRLVSAVQPGIEPTDLPTYAAAAVVWIAVTLVACYLPARRAARVDPVVALRCE